MSKLLYAELKRLFRLKSLYVSLGIILFQHAFNLISEAGSDTVIAGDLPFLLDSHIPETSFLVTVLAALVIGNLIGTEYSCGTVRNKLAVGNDRLHIYFSSCIAGLCSVLLMLFFGYAAVLIIGLSLGGKFEYGAEYHVPLLLISLLYALVLTALYVLIAMNVLSKSNTLTLCIILGGVMLIGNIVLFNMLMEPEYVDAAPYMMSEYYYTAERSPDNPDMIKNPNFIGSTKQKIFKALDTLLPCSAVIEYNGTVKGEKITAQVCELILFTAAGAFAFRKRDLK